jgi:hypothetical protein
MVNPRSDGVQEITGERLQQLKSRMEYGPEILRYNPQKDDLEYLGSEDFEGTDVFVFKLTHDGQVSRYYIDTESFVLLKSTRKRNFRGEDLEIASHYSNYKLVDGIAIPHSMVTATAGRQEGGPGGRMGRMPGGNQEIEIIEFNRDLDDALFQKPVIE